MRLWHKDLIDVLPRQQLLGQWREWFAIAKNIQEIGTPNHILVNRIMDHGLNDFLVYGFMVYQELKRRGYKVDFSKFSEYMANGFYIRQLEEDPTIYVISGSKIGSSSYTEHYIHADTLFYFWHNEEYLDECYYNLREKWHCGGISDKDWKKIEEKYWQLLEEYE